VEHEQLRLRRWRRCGDLTARAGSQFGNDSSSSRARRRASFIDRWRGMEEAVVKNGNTKLLDQGAPSLPFLCLGA